MLTRALLVLMLAASIAPQAAAQGTAGRLHSARELYVSARYEEALALLNALRPGDAATIEDRRAIEQYRALCLLALGRSTEAEEAIAAIVTADPMYQPSDVEAAPRVRAAFSEVRQRVLPGLALSRYSAAKRLYDRKEYAAAGDAFREVLRLLDDEAMKGQHADLRVLATGFLDLSAAAAPPPEAAEDVPAPTPTAAAPIAEANRIYTADDPGVVLPVVIKQDLPRVPSVIAAHVRDRGVVEIVVDELGRVTQVVIRMSLHPMYDNLVLAAARDWRYQPATLGGTAVKFRKLIQVALDKR